MWLLCFVASFAMAAGIVMLFTGGELSGRALNLAFALSIMGTAAVGAFVKQKRDAYEEDLRRRGVCLICKGSGKQSRAHPWESGVCNGCNGRGVFGREEPFDPYKYELIERGLCVECGGSGKRVKQSPWESDVCLKCNGTGLYTR